MVDAGSNARVKEKPVKPRRPLWVRFVHRVMRQARKRKSEKQPETVSDKAARRTALATIAIAFLTLVLAVVSYFQWREIHAGSTDTHNLAVAAGNQATWTQNLATNMQTQADRTKDLADRMKDQADRTRDLANETKTIAGQAIVEANAAKSAADTANVALHISERAYIVTGAPVLQLDTDVVSIPVVNTGRIPSGDLRIVVHEATIEVEPSAPPSIIIPIEQHWQHYDVTSMPSSNGAAYTINTPVPAAVASMINSGRQQIIIAGSIVYHDGFSDTPERTWLFCSAGLYFQKLQRVEWTPCDPVLYVRQLTVGDHYPNNEYTGEPDNRWPPKPN